MALTVECESGLTLLMVAVLDHAQLRKHCRAGRLHLT